MSEQNNSGLELICATFISIQKKAPTIKKYSDVVKYIEGRLESYHFYPEEVQSLFEFEFGLAHSDTANLLGYLGEMGFLCWAGGDLLTRAGIFKILNNYRERLYQIKRTNKVN